MIVNVIILYSCFIKSINEISERSFIYGTKHFNNQWEYGCYTTYDKTKNRFELVPGDRYSEGFVWSSNRLPRTNWSVRAVFEFSLDSELNNFAIWITSRFGPTGEVFGGPDSFVGVAILFKFSLGKLEIELRQNDGSDKYNPLIFFPQFSKKLEYPKISLNISFFSNEALTIFLNFHNKSKKNEFIQIFDGKPIVSLSHFWVGVTSYNPKDGKPLFLKSIQVEGLKSKFDINNIKIIKNRNLSSILNSSENDNKELIEKISQIQQNGILYNNEILNIFDIIKCIEVLINTSNKMLRQKLLTHIIHTKTIQFTESWQRRSLMATNDFKFLRKTVQDEMTLIEQEISSLSYFVWKSFKKFQYEINEIANEIIYSYDNELKIKKKELKDINGNYMRTLLFYIMIFEFIIMFISFVYLLIIKEKQKMVSN